jgi:hypothetical protein
VFAVPFPSKGCLCWFHSSCLEQICHSVQFFDHLSDDQLPKKESRCHRVRLRILALRVVNNVSVLMIASYCRMNKQITYVNWGVLFSACVMG